MKRLLFASIIIGVVASLSLPSVHRTPPSSTYIVHDDAGVPLPSLFSKVTTKGQFRTTPSGDCKGVKTKQTTFVDRIVRALGLAAVVHADPGCAGAFFTDEERECVSYCLGGTYFGFYQDYMVSDPCDGWQYDMGNETCAECHQLPEIYCDSCLEG